MEPEVAKKYPESSPKRGKRNILLIIISVSIVFMLASASVFAYMTLQRTGVYKGVYINRTEVSGMNIEGVKQLLDLNYQETLSSLEITLRAGKAELKATYPELGITYDLEMAAENAYAIGRSGNIFDRLYDIGHAGINGIVLDMLLAVPYPGLGNDPG